MKNFLLVLFLTCTLVTPVFAGGKSVSVRGYTRKDGTYVAPYTRSAPGSKSGYSSSYKSSSGYSSGSDYSLPPSDSVKVDGYYRKDGTYVRPHYRSSPDDDKSNNFGQPSNEQRQEYKASSTLPTYKYDFDKDGIRNAQDKDDDNDGVSDNNDKAQYNPDEF
jgi:hypothetical protein